MSSKLAVITQKPVTKVLVKHTSEVSRGAIIMLVLDYIKEGLRALLTSILTGPALGVTGALIILVITHCAMVLCSLEEEV